MNAAKLSMTDVEKARRYLEVLERGEFSDLAGLFAPQMVSEQFPSRIYPQGMRFSLAEMAQSFAKGRTLLARQTYQIRNEVVAPNRIALEVLWTGVLAVPLATLPAGSQMRAHFAMFLDFEDGKITSQRNYDCFDPW